MVMLHDAPWAERRGYRRLDSMYRQCSVCLEITTKRYFPVKGGKGLWMCGCSTYVCI